MTQVKMCPDSTLPQPAHPGMYLSLLNPPPHNVHYLFLTYLTITPPYPCYTLRHSQPHVHIQQHSPTFHPTPYSRLSSDSHSHTDCTLLHTHEPFHCSRINSSLHIPPMLQANTRCGSPDNGHDDARNMLS